MSTRITVTSDTSALVGRVRVVQQANREAQLERERDAKLQADIEAEVANTQPDANAPRGGNPDTQVDKRPAAQRDVGYALWTANWLAPVRVGDTGIASEFGATLKYNYIASKDLEFLQSLKHESPTKEPRKALAITQGEFAISTTGGTLGNSSNHGSLPVIVRAGEFAGAAYGGGDFYFTQAPVVSSANGILYGVQRHSYGQINTPWSRLGTGSIVPGAGTTYFYTYIYFRFNARTGKLDYTSDSVSYTHDPSTGVANLAPYVEGGAVWTQKYAENAYPNDPALPVRALGYYGDYHVIDNTAHFLRYNSGGIYYFNLSSAFARLLWNRGSSLKWVSFPIIYSSPAELKVELESCMAELLVREHVIKEAFPRQSEQRRYNTLSQAVRDYTLPTNGDQYWDPTGPYIYPLLLPP